MGLFSWGSQPTSLLGVDIAAGGVKIVELSTEKGRPTLLTYGYADRRPGEHPVSPLENTKAAGEMLGEVCKKAGVKAVKAVTALPISSVFSTILSLPRQKNEQDMKALIDMQVAKVTPLPLSEMVLYPTYIDDLKKPAAGATGASKDYVRVLITGAAKTLIQKYIEIFQVSKHELVAIDTEAFALIRALVGKDQGGILILDLGYKRSNITVVESGIPFLTRSVNIGGSSVTKKLMEQLGVGEAEAEQVKHDLGSMIQSGAQTIAGGMPTLLEAVMQPILNEIKVSMDLYVSMESTRLKRVEKILITGGSAHLPHLPEYLSSVLNMNVYRGDPWARVAYPTDLRPVLDEIGPRMSVAVGLAMRDGS